MLWLEKNLRRGRKPREIDQNATQPRATLGEPQSLSSHNKSGSTKSL